MWGFPQDKWPSFFNKEVSWNKNRRGRLFQIRDLKDHGWNMFESVKKAFFENQENLTWTGY